jgi:hypothetical protein
MRSTLRMRDAHGTHQKGLDVRHGAPADLACLVVDCETYVVLVFLEQPHRVPQRHLAGPDPERRHKAGDEALERPAKEKGV